MRRRLCITALALLLGSVLPAAGINSYRRYDVRSGLSDNSVKDICQDKNGYMWFATKDGLNRFDGHQFDVFGSSLTGDLLNIDVILPHSDGIRIWVGSTQSLMLFDPRDESFVKFDMQSGDGAKILNSNSLFYDLAGNLWIGSEKGLFQWDEQSRRLVRFDLHDSCGESCNIIRSIFGNSQGDIWIGTIRGLFRYDRSARNNFSPALRPNPESTLMGDNEITAIVQIEEDKLLIGTQNGHLAEFDIGTGKFKGFPAISTDGKRFSVTRIHTIFRKSGNIYMIGSDSGLFLFNSEVTGITHEKLKPKIGETSKKLWSVYVSLTAILWFLLWLGPMEPFDAICHAFSTMATGGFSTKQASVSYWNSPYIDYVITIFTFVAGINFALVYRAVTGDFKKLLNSEETKWYTSITLGITALVVIGLYATGQNSSLEETFRIAIFQVVTVITSTGYTVGDYVAWGPFFTTIFLLLMFFGACAGSTCGGAKIDRLVVLAKNTKNEFYRAIHPNAILPVRMNGKAISHEVVSKILAFILVYVMVLIAGAVVLSALGLPIEEAFGSTLSCLSNIGPGAGSTGPTGNYAFIPDIGKWTLSVIMLIGRLELFTVLILFTSYFWKNS